MRSYMDDKVGILDEQRGDAWFDRARGNAEFHYAGALEGYALSFYVSEKTDRNKKLFEADIKRVQQKISLLRANRSLDDRLVLK